MKPSDLTDESWARHKLAGTRLDYFVTDVLFVTGHSSLPDGQVMNITCRWEQCAFDVPELGGYCMIYGLPEGQDYPSDEKIQSIIDALLINRLSKGL